MSAEKYSAPPLDRGAWEALDRRAWALTRNWTARAGVDTTHRGLDFAELTCWFLWDKVGRALRREAMPEDFAAEAGLLGWNDAAPAVPVPPTAGQWLRTKAAAVRHKVHALTAQHALRRAHMADAPLRAMVPVPSARLARAAQALIAHGGIEVYAPRSAHCTIEGAIEVPYPPRVPEPDYAFGEALCSGILRGLAAQGAPLLAPDAEKLRAQIRTQLKQVVAHELMLHSVAPDLILVHADNHPTHQHYVAIARRDGIPSVMLQHGLDCERFYLDEAFADFIAVWGPERKQRYEAQSLWRPRAIKVIGNPEYDDRRLPTRIDRGGNGWLWVTRPHAPDKCYAPSRSVLEGVRIFEALLAALRDTPGAALTVKPHPYDAVDALRGALAQSGLAERARIVETPVAGLLRDAAVVVSEDSTAGMEAMFMGKPVVHAHFAPSPPAVPFAAYGAALPAYDAGTLRASLRVAAHLDADAARAMLEGQRKFLLDFAGPCDGRAAERATEFLIASSGRRGQ